MVLEPREAGDDFVSWGTCDEKRDALLVTGLYGEGEWLSDGPSSCWPTVESLNRTRRGEWIDCNFEGGGKGLIHKVSYGAGIH